MLSTERPSTRRANREADITAAPPERPRTSRRRRAEPEREPLHHSSYVPSQIDDGQNTPRGTTSQMTNPYERPGTSRGFRNIESTDFDIVEFEGIERPKTSRGRRPNQGQSESTNYESGRGERPKTSRGNRGRPLESPTDSGPPPENRSGEGEVNILTLESESQPEQVTPRPKREGVTRPKSRYGQRSRVATQQTVTTQPRDTGPMRATEPMGDMNQHQQPPQQTPSPGREVPHTPPARPPSSPAQARPPSSRGRIRTPSGSSDNDRSNTPGSRPTSATSLSKYNVLPSIPRTPRGGRVDKPASETTVHTTAEPHTEPKTSTPAPPASATSESGIVTLKPKVEQVAPSPRPEPVTLKPTGSVSQATPVKSEDNNTKTVAKPEEHVVELKPLTREVKLPEEPKVEPRVLLAVKLPDGRRVQRHFNPSDKLEAVLNFAEISSKNDLTGFHIICDAPRKVFSDLKITLKESGLQNRTVVHMQSPDD